MKSIFFIIPAIAITSAWSGRSIPTSSAALTNGVVINEVLFGSGLSAKREFIELYNAGADAVDLAGWTLRKKTASGSESTLVSAAKFSGTVPAGGYFLISPPEYQAEFKADLAYSGATYSIATNNTVLLYNAEGILVDKVGWGAAGDFEIAPAPDPGVDQALTRSPEGKDSDDNAADFQVADPAPQASVTGQNGGPGENGDDGGSADSGGIDGPAEPADGAGTDEKHYPFGAVLINEFVSDPADGETEWVELANAWGADIVMSGWTLEDGSGAKTVVSGKLDVDGPGRYLAIAKPKGNLNNKGDAIILRDADGAAIDSVAYGDWADGNAGDNAPAAGDPYSLGRCPDGVSTRNNRADFLVLAGPAKGSANDCASALLEDEDGGGSAVSGANGPGTFSLPAGLVFSEAMPDPEGADPEGEFVEFYNSSPAAIDICGWRLGDASNKRYRLEADKTRCRIAPRSFLLVERGKSGIALNNDQDSVRLFAPEGETALLTADYGEARQGLSYACLDGDNAVLAPCVWSRSPTPGTSNMIDKANRPPLAVFALPAGALSGAELVFDAGDSTDEDGDRLSFLWDFGDGATSSRARSIHIYAKPGEYQVVLSVADGSATSTAKKTLSVAGQAAAASGPESGYDILINEFMPDPDGSDDEEWIELYNRGGERVLLRDWRLDDAEGGSRAYAVKDAVWIAPGAYYLFERAETGLALNNNEDAVRLFYPDGTLAEAVDYEGAKEGMAYARGGDGLWSWSLAPTPGGPNSIKVSSAKASETKSSSAKASETKSSSAKSAAIKATSAKTAPTALRSVALKDVRLLDAGDDVIVRGWVAVLPGVLGSQYFYIHDQDGGAQVYSYKKDFPALKVGDFIEARGEIGIAGGERRVKTKTRADIRVLERKEGCPAPAAFKCEDLIEEAAGRLVMVAGEVSERKSSNVRLDDGTGEGAVYVKSATGINAARFRPGDRAEVTGIVALSADGARVLPRSNEDIKIARDTAGNNVLGAVEASSTWALPEREGRIGWYYAAVAAGFLLSMLGWWVWGRRKIADQ